MFLTADGVYRAAGDYRLVQRGILARSPWIFGVGALFAAMSLAAMPPQGRVRQRVVCVPDLFPGLSSGKPGQPADGGARRRRFGADRGGRLCDLTSRCSASACWGAATAGASAVPLATSLAVGLLGALVLAFAVGMPVWLERCRLPRYTS